jgi:transcriptional regulator with GAF, ATPase, and Fis domain
MELAMTQQQQVQLGEAFVELADTLVDQYDVLEFLNRLSGHTTTLLDTDAAGLLLADHRGQLALVAASAEEPRLLELFQLQNDEGPCLDCYRTGQSVTVSDLEAEATRWPAFAEAARAHGYRSVHALPMRLREETIGTLNLFGSRPGALAPDQLRVAQALADVATIGILQERAIHRAEILAEQLQTALNSRVLIEQAKGLLAAHGNLSMDAAFDRLRSYARNHNRRLSELALAVVERQIPASQIIDG